MNYQVLGSNFIVSSMYGSIKIDEIDLLKTDMTIAKSGQKQEILNFIHSNTDPICDKYLKLWLGLILWYESNYRDAYKLFKYCEGMIDYCGRLDFRPYWYQAILIKDEMRTWDTWFSALGNFRSLANKLIKEVVNILGVNFNPSHVYLEYLNGEFSQAGHDTLIEDFFRVNPPMYKKFVDIGAFDGISMSNTHKLFKNGWGGLCVEPIKKSFVSLKSLYKGTNVICVNCAIGLENTEVKMEVNENPMISKVLFGNTRAKTQRIKMNTINTVLESNNIDNFDFLNIDVENLNVEIINSIDLVKYTPLMIVIEYNGNTDIKSNIINTLKRYEYKLWFDNLQDLFMCKTNSISEPAFWDIKTLIPTRSSQ